MLFKFAPVFHCIVLEVENVPSKEIEVANGKIVVVVRLLLSREKENFLFELCSPLFGS